MAEDQDVDSATSRAKADDKPTCGIIMPISATANHSEAHWASVRVLLMRAIEKAGFKAAPVWENSSVDRVSERIIGNIFQFPLVIADISDSNPNVMLELGLRLASKKPTVVVVNSGGTIPFDIRDFHALHYPPSLSILDMETFIEDLAGVLIQKDEASKKEGYVPFLGNIIVDVVQPKEREVPIQQFVLDRLNEINSKLSRAEPRRESGTFNIESSGATHSITNPLGTAYFFTFRKTPISRINSVLQAGGYGGKVNRIGWSSVREYIAIVFDDIIDPSLADNFQKTLEEMMGPIGGTLGVPTKVAESSAIF